jgi:NodT family efflux transporter outer membrane factor (OMF) lipoprotein
MSASSGFLVHPNGTVELEGLHPEVEQVNFSIPLSASIHGLTWHGGCVKGLIYVRRRHYSKRMRKPYAESIRVRRARWKLAPVPSAERTVAWAKSALVAVVAFAIVLTGCAVGPDFVRPAPPRVTAYVSKKIPVVLTPSGKEPAQHLVIGQAIPAAWWRVFHSASLDSVVQQAIAASPTLDAARATLAQAQQALLEARAAYYPWFDFAAAAERQQGPAFVLGILPSGSLPVFNLYTLGPTVSFSPDVFGGTRRQVEQQAALAQNKAFELAAAQLTLTGNVVTEALTIASTRQQIRALRSIIADDEKNLALVQNKFEVGRVPSTDVLLAESQLSNDRALLPPLRQQLAAAQDALAVLAGKFPADWRQPDFELADFTLPDELPVSVPSALVHQRPDILAAEAQLHAASAAIGVATAQMYPNITLSASVETAAVFPSDLFQSSGLAWTLLGGVTNPIFHGGALEAQKRAAIDAFRASFATYRQTVLQAFGQVADNLRALNHDTQLVDATRRALDVADRSLELQRFSYAGGKTDIIPLLDAERADQQARLAYARAEAQRYIDSAQLFVAMGGGWWEDRSLCGDCRELLGMSGALTQAAGASPSHVVK